VVGFIGRKTELGQLRAAVAKNENILVFGKVGIGKTALLRAFARRAGYMFWREPNGLRPLLLRICKRLDISTTGLAISELLAAIESRKPQRVVVVLDDLHEASKRSARLIAELAAVVTIVGAAEAPLKGRLDWTFKRKLRLGPLSRRDAMMLLGKAYSDAVYRESRGYPLALLAGGFHPCVLAERVDLLPVSLLAPLAYLLLSMRYLALIEDQHGFYLLFGLFGFLLLSLNRGRRIWK
jgi:hypothetical protein